MAKKQTSKRTKPATKSAARSGGRSAAKSANKGGRKTTAKSTKAGRKTTARSAAKTIKKAVVKAAPAKSGRKAATRAAAKPAKKSAAKLAGPAAAKATRRAASPKPGSSSREARKVGGRGDFGARAGGARTADRDYASRNTKLSDPGAAQPWGFEQDAVRDHGAGGRDSGPGSASGGDIDTDIVGVGTGGSGVAVSGVTGRPPGPDDSDGSSDEFAAGGHAEGRNQTHTGGKVGGSKRVTGGTTHSADLDASTSDAQGASAVTNPVHELGGDLRHAPHDSPGDAFAGEVSMGEAMGDDNDEPSTADAEPD